MIKRRLFAFNIMIITVDTETEYKYTSMYIDTFSIC